MSLTDKPQGQGRNQIHTKLAKHSGFFSFFFLRFWAEFKQDRIVCLIHYPLKIHSFILLLFPILFLLLLLSFSSASSSPISSSCFSFFFLLFSRLFLLFFFFFFFFFSLSLSLSLSLSYLLRKNQESVSRNHKTFYVQYFVFSTVFVLFLFHITLITMLNFYVESSSLQCRDGSVVKSLTH